MSTTLTGNERLLASGQSISTEDIVNLAKSSGGGAAVLVESGNAEKISAMAPWPGTVPASFIPVVQPGDPTNYQVAMIQALTGIDGSGVNPGESISIGAGSQGTGSGGPGSVSINAGNSGAKAGGQIQLYGGNAGSGNNAGGDILLNPGTGAGAGRVGLIITVNVPTADPHVVGAIYSVAGALHISAG